MEPGFWCGLAPLAGRFSPLAFEGSRGPRTAHGSLRALEFDTQMLGVERVGDIGVEALGEQ